MTLLERNCLFVQLSYSLLYLTFQPFLHYVQSQQLDIHYVSQLVKENKQEQMHDGKLPTKLMATHSWNFKTIHSKPNAKLLKFQENER